MRTTKEEREIQKWKVIQKSGKRTTKVEREIPKQEENNKSGK